MRISERCYSSLERLPERAETDNIVSMQRSMLWFLEINSLGISIVSFFTGFGFCLMDLPFRLDMSGP